MFLNPLFARWDTPSIINLLQMTFWDKDGQWLGWVLRRGSAAWGQPGAQVSRERGQPTGSGITRVLVFRVRSREPRPLGTWSTEEPPEVNRFCQLSREPAYVSNWGPHLLVGSLEVTLMQLSAIT